MPKKRTKKKRDRRKFSSEQKRAIVAEIGPHTTVKAVAAKHDLGATMLGGWRKKFGSKPADAPPASNGSNGAPTLVIDSEKGWRLAVHGLSPYIRTVVRDELRPIVREELARLTREGVG